MDEETPASDRARVGKLWRAASFTKLAYGDAIWGVIEVSRSFQSPMTKTSWVGYVVSR